MATNYDKIATRYDRISRIVFGKALINAQVSVLKYIPANSRILIAGGGTGWILEALASVHPQGLTIDYVESSAQMTALSKKRNSALNKINFINLAIENYTVTELYDVILTPFFFDNFSADKIRFIFTKLNASLKNNGTWLYIDFVLDKSKKRLWQKALLKVMYLFFSITANIETQQLIDMDIFFDPLFDKIDETSHYFNFVKASVYRKCKILNNK